MAVIAFIGCTQNLAACYALEGRMEEAKSALAEARRLNPELTVKWYKDHTMDIPNRSKKDYERRGWRRSECSAISP